MSLGPEAFRGLVGSSGHDNRNPAEHRLLEDRADAVTSWFLRTALLLLYFSYGKACLFGSSFFEFAVLTSRKDELMLVFIDEAVA